MPAGTEARPTQFSGFYETELRAKASSPMILLGNVLIYAKLSLARNYVPKYNLGTRKKVYVGCVLRTINCSNEKFSFLLETSSFSEPCPGETPVPPGLFMIRREALRFPAQQPSNVGADPRVRPSGQTHGCAPTERLLWEKPSQAAES